MLHKKTFLAIFAIIFFNNSVFAHGPSRQKVSESIEIEATATDVWKIVSDFKNFNWNENIKEITTQSGEVGSERVITFKTGENVKQKLEKLDQEKMMVNWRILETNNSILPVNSYSSKIFVKSSDGKTVVQYVGFYRGFMGNDPPPELNDENSKKLVRKFIKENLKGLKNTIEKK